MLALYKINYIMEILSENCHKTEIFNLEVYQNIQMCLMATIFLVLKAQWDNIILLNIKSVHYWLILEKFNHTFEIKHV